MLYKPKYCCQCGEEIERIDWKLWTSRRFCELCETDFVAAEWAPKVYFGLSIVLAFVFVGSSFRSPEKSSNIVSGRSPAKLAAANQSSGQLEKTPANDRAEANSGATPAGQKQTNQINERGAPSSELPKKPEKAESLYFCGAETKKGTPCSRRVKGGGRCWQHQGKSAMVPEKELKMNQ